MGLVEELEKLQQMKEAGALTDEEFRLAKDKLLHTEGIEKESVSQSDVVEALNDVMEKDTTLGQAANRYIDYKYVTAIIGVILFIIMAILIFGQMSRMSNKFNTPSPFHMPR